MHAEDLADVLGEKPVVLLFATPALCQSRVCGPVVDVTEQVKSEYGDEAAFIHQEIFVDNEFDPKNPNLRPQVRAFGLPTEPWLFVIDENGDVSTRIEGAFSVARARRGARAGRRLISRVPPGFLSRPPGYPSRESDRNRKESTMRSKGRDKAGGTMDKVRGRMKEAGGALSGNEKQKAKGQAKQAKGEARKKRGHARDLLS